MQGCCGARAAVRLRAPGPPAAHVGTMLGCWRVGAGLAGLRNRANGARARVRAVMSCKGCELAGLGSCPKAQGSGPYYVQRDSISGTAAHQAAATAWFCASEAFVTTPLPQCHDTRHPNPNPSRRSSMAGASTTCLIRLLFLCLAVATATAVAPSCTTTCPAEQPAGVTCLVGMNFSNVPAAVDGSGLCVCNAAGPGYAAAILSGNLSTIKASCTTNACLAAGQSMSGQTAEFMNSTRLAAFLLALAQGTDNMDGTLNTPTIGVMCASASLFCNAAAAQAGSCPSSMIGTTMTLQYAVLARECERGLASILGTAAADMYNDVGTYLDFSYPILSFYGRYPRFGEQLYSIQMCTTDNCNVAATPSTQPTLCVAPAAEPPAATAPAAEPPAATAPAAAAPSAAGSTPATVPSTVTTANTFVSATLALSGYTVASFGTGEAAAFKGAIAAPIGVAASDVTITSVAAAARRRLLATSGVSVAFSVRTSASVSSVTAAVTSVTASSLRSAGLSQLTAVAVSGTPSATTTPPTATTTLPITAAMTSSSAPAKAVRSALLLGATLVVLAV